MIWSNFPIIVFPLIITESRQAMCLSIVVGNMRNTRIDEVSLKKDRARGRFDGNMRKGL